MLSRGGQWFFDTREGVEQGPFPGMTEAEEAVAEYAARSVRKP